MMRRWGRHSNAPNQGATMVGISLDVPGDRPFLKGWGGGPRRFSLASPFLSQDFCHHPNVSNLGEKRRGDRYSEVVQSGEGLWIHSAREWRQGRVCSHLCRREGGSERFERGRDGKLRNCSQPRERLC